MPPTGEYSLYFHLPFCTRKCPYCHFYVLPHDLRFQKLYLEALRKEWELRKGALRHAGKLVSLYFGGGTPHLLGAEAIETILSWVSPGKEVEITLETNPEVTAPLPRGITRVSLGVQSFDQALLTTLSRTHTVEESYAALSRIREGGIENITIDLMYDLPGQSLESWRKTVARACLLPITHLSLYNLTLEPHTLFYKKRAELIPHLPSAETSVQMLDSAIDLLEAAGLLRYEVSAFAKPGYHSRHNVGYWTGRPFLGFGPSASSYWEGSRFRNLSRLHPYADALARGVLPIEFHEKLSPLESCKELLALRLRLLTPPTSSEGYFFDAASASGQRAWLERVVPLLEKEGFWDGEQHRLSRRGLLFHDTVAEIIMNALP